MRFKHKHETQWEARDYLVEHMSDGLFDAHYFKTLLTTDLLGRFGSLKEAKASCREHFKAANAKYA